LPRTRRTVAALAVTAVSLLSLAAPALAGAGPVDADRRHHRRRHHRSITNVHGTAWTGGYLACVTALNDDGSQAGTSDCQAAGTLANHDYNGTLGRGRGMVYPFPRDNISGTTNATRHTAAPRARSHLTHPL
jgi:hypothetical protein